MSKLSFQELRDNAPIWMSDEGIHTLRKGYLQPLETPNGMYERISKGASKYYPNGIGNISQEELEADFLFAFLKGWISPATPVAANLGSTGNGMVVSCFGLQVQNTIKGIFDSVKEAALLTKHGGGLGVDLSKVKGMTNVKDWAKFFDLVATVTSQNGVRRGAVGIYLDVDHPNIIDFLNAKDLLDGDVREKLECNIGVKITRDFLTSLRNDDKSAIAVFSKIMEMRMKFGSPYLQFMENCWEGDPVWYKEQGMRSGASQLCLTGDTLVATKEGAKEIKSLVGKEVEIYDGSKWVVNKNFFHNGKSKVLEIELINGEKIRMTPDHRCPVYANTSLGIKTVVIPASDLKDHDKLVCAGEKEPDKYCLKNITELEGEHDVYCTTVESTGFFALANGVLTGNCSEIHLFHDRDHSYSCVLSSLNADKADEWMDFRFKSGITLPQLAIFFLDAVNEDFVVRGSNIDGLERAVAGAKKGRPLGLGVLGLHSLYMKKGYPWLSLEAFELNVRLFKFIQEESWSASAKLAKYFGEPEWMKGYGFRNTHLSAIAPTTTNSVLCNAGSPGIEPVIGHYFAMAGAKGTFTRQNKYLEELLEKKKANTGSVWASIREHHGSVQHLSILTDREKDVFKTAFEISQQAIIEQAADRQQYICQGQSLNLFFNHDTPAQDIVDVHLNAEKLGLKALYYVRSTSPIKTANIVSGINFVVIKTREDCKYCKQAKELLNQYGIKYLEEEKSIGKVPEIWIEGEMLDDGYNSLYKRLMNVEPTAIAPKSSDCLSCEG